MSYSIDGNTITMSGSLIPSDFSITFKAELPDGYWKDPLNNEWTIGLGGYYLSCSNTIFDPVVSRWKRS